MSKMMLLILVVCTGSTVALAAPRTKAACTASINKASKNVASFVDKTTPDVSRRDGMKKMFKELLENAKKNCVDIEGPADLSTAIRDRVNNQLNRYVGTGDFAKADLLD